MRLRSLETADLTDKTVLYRSPYDINVEDDGTLTDESRIEATLPTLQYLLEKQCKIVILTFVGRPDGKVVESLRTTPHAEVLARLLNHPVQKLDECIGDEVQSFIHRMHPGEIVMLENTRFHPEEMTDDDSFALELAKNGEVVVFDAFPQAHRAHASVTGIMRHLPSYAGFYCIKEASSLSGILESPKRPFTVIIGGAKVSDKVDAINNLFNVADQFLVGGGVANVFLKAAGHDMADSYVEDVFVDAQKKVKKDWVEYAKELLEKAQKSDKIVMPVDVVVGESSDYSFLTQVMYVDGKQAVAPGWAAFDIGPATAQMYADIIHKSGTVFWNGPMGKFEDDRFANGSKIVAQAMANSKNDSIVGGGDTIAVINRFSNPTQFTHISLAGGATLEFIAGKKLPALEMLREE
ncbi:phosphoglycerate kinase [candidate division WWE3 bacterium]|nr:phosphoglycerate kinase [candidate division WWE3 bacterium]